MRRVALAGVALAAVLATLGCVAERGHGPRVTLRYHPAPGSSFRYVVEQHYTASGQEVGAVAYVTQTIDARTDSGISISLRTDSARLLMSPPQGLDPRAGRQLRQARDEMTAQLRSFAGAVRYDDRMQVVHASYTGGVPALSCPLGGGVTGLAVPLPDWPVGVGAAWRREFSFSSGLLPLASERAAPRALLTYVLDTLAVAGADTTVVIGIETRLPHDPITAGQTGTRVTFDAAGPRGEKVFSVTRGALVGGRLEGAVHAHLSGGIAGERGTEVTLNVRCTLRLLS